jgi:hypothetical protein
VLLGATAEKLKKLGIETIGIVASRPERTRLFFRYRPVRFTVGADPALLTHRAYGAPRTAVTPEIMQAIGGAYVKLAHELKLEVPEGQAQEVIGRLDGFEVTASEGEEFERHQAQLTAQFLVDRQGIVRWANVECSRDGLAGVDQFPTDDVIEEAARALPD